MKKTAKDHLHANKQEKVVVLENDFAGVKRGQTLFVGTPQIVDKYLTANSALLLGCATNSLEKVTPFWRLLTSQDKISKKLTIDVNWIDEQRTLESEAF